MESPTAESSTKTSTGVEGIDMLLNGGLPKQKTILVLGGPGTGKSILCAQFLNDGLEKQNENSIYVSLDYSKNAFMHDMMNFGWDFKKWEDKNSFFFLEGSAIRRIPHTKSFEGTLYSPDDLTLDDLTDLLSLYVEKIKAKRIVIDDLTALIFRYPDLMQRRAAILSLIESLNALGVTSLVISEATQIDFGREIKPEEYLADGVIDMFTLKDGTRVIQISKMRGVSVEIKPHPYAITEKVGIDVFPHEAVYDGH